MLEKKRMGRPTDNPKPTRITIRVNDSTNKWLEEYCDKKNLSKSDVLRQALENFMKK